MPDRPRQHVIEDASRRAFEALLPSHWVYRQQTHDYGIDGEVEMFEEGRAVGLTFKVQLKGTEQADNFIVRLTHEKAAYYASLSEPVLIVLHHAPSDRVLARWFRSFDPQVDVQTETSIGLRFGDGDQLTPDNVERLRGDVETNRRLSDPRRALPLRLMVEREGAHVAGCTIASVAMALRDAALVFPDVLVLAATPDEFSMGTISLRPTDVRIDCRSLISSTVHYPDPWPSAPNLELVLSDIMVMLGVILNRIGQYDAAARLFAEYCLGSSVIKDESTVATIAGALTRTHRMAEAINILEGLSDEDVSMRMLTSMSITWTSHPDALNESEREAVVQYLGRQAQKEETPGNNKRAAIAHYNLANRLRALGRSDQAVQEFRKAAELDPTYPDRDYYSGEFAGSLFESGDFESAVEFYRRAAESARERYLPLLADALLMSGRFSASRETFRAVVSEDMASRNPAEWRLKLRILDSVIEFAGEQQSRSSDRAFYLADVSASTLSDE